MFSALSLSQQLRTLSAVKAPCFSSFAALRSEPPGSARRASGSSIDDLFDAFVSARSAGAAKPAQPIFDAAVEAGGASAHETLHVGDHPEIDVDGARSAGLRAVWVNRNGTDWPGALARPDGIVRDLEELDRLLAEAEEMV